MNRTKIPSIFNVILRIAALFALIEICIMLAFIFVFTDCSPLLETLIDAALLTAIATPLMYFMVIKPYTRTIHELLDSIEKQACTDYLTQLGNRRAFEAHLQRLVSYTQRHSVFSALLYIDLDGFKEINDQYSHAAGDFVLLAIANRLRALVRQEDLIFRVGGDEFIICIAQIGSSSEEAIKLAKSIAIVGFRSLSQPIEYEGKIIYVAASLGLRIVKPIDQSLEKIIAEADEAMYMAKKSKKHKIIVFGEPVNYTEAQPS